MEANGRLQRSNSKCWWKLPRKIVEVFGVGRLANGKLDGSNNKCLWPKCLIEATNACGQSAWSKLPRSIEAFEANKNKFHTCGGPRRRPCLGEGGGRRIYIYIYMCIYIYIYAYLSHIDTAKCDGSKTPHAWVSDSKVWSCSLKHDLFLTVYDFVQSWLNTWDESSHCGRKLRNHVIAWRSSVHFQETRVAWSDITCMSSLNMELQHRSNLHLEVTWSDHSKALWTINLYKLHQPHCDIDMMLSTGESSSKWPDFRLIVSPESWKNKFGLWQNHGTKFLSIFFFEA